MFAGVLSVIQLSILVQRDVRLAGIWPNEKGKRSAWVAKGDVLRWGGKPPLDSR